MNKELIKYVDIHKKILEMEKFLKQDKNKKLALSAKTKHDSFLNSKKKLILENEKALTDLNKYLAVKDKGIKLIKDIESKDVSNMDTEDIKAFKSKVHKASTDLRKLEGLIDKNYTAIKTNSEKIKDMDSNLKEEKLNFDKYRELYLEEEKKSNNEVLKLKNSLEEQEKKVDNDLIKLYKSVRTDIVSPVVVEKNETCGGCGTRFSIDTIEKIKSNGYIRCENCTRIVFVQK